MAAIAFTVNCKGSSTGDCYSFRIACGCLLFDETLALLLTFPSARPSGLIDWFFLPCYKCFVDFRSESCVEFVSFFSLSLSHRELFYFSLCLLVRWDACLSVKQSPLSHRSHPLSVVGSTQTRIHI